MSVRVDGGIASGVFGDAGFEEPVEVVTSGAQGIIAATVLVPVIKDKGGYILICQEDGKWISSPSSITEEKGQFVHTTHSWQAVQLLKGIGGVVNTVTTTDPYREIEQSTMTAEGVKFLGQKCDAIFKRVVQFNPTKKGSEPLPDTIGVYICEINPKDGKVPPLSGVNIKFVNKLTEVSADKTSQFIFKRVMEMLKPKKEERSSLFTTCATVVGVMAFAFLAYNRVGIR